MLIHIRVRQRLMFQKPSWRQHIKNFIRVLWSYGTHTRPSIPILPTVLTLGIGYFKFRVGILLRHQILTFLRTSPVVFEIEPVRFGTGLRLGQGLSLDAKKFMVLENRKDEHTALLPRGRWFFKQLELNFQQPWFVSYLAIFGPKKMWLRLCKA